MTEKTNPAKRASEAESVIMFEASLKLQDGEID